MRHQKGAALLVAMLVMALVATPARTRCLHSFHKVLIMRSGEPTSRLCRSTYVAKPSTASAIIRGVVPLQAHPKVKSSVGPTALPMSVTTLKMPSMPEL